MTDATVQTDTPDPKPCIATRRRLRQERQARVGLLRNPNQPPKPRPRRAALMGKWLDLRSSRRARHADAMPKMEGRVAADPQESTTMAPEPPTVAQAIAHDDAGQVSAINIAGLMEAVRDVGTQQPARAPYAAGYRPDLELTHRARTRKAAPSVLSAQAWVDEEDGADLSAPDPLSQGAAPIGHGAPRRLNARSRGLVQRVLRIALIAIGGLAVAVAILIAFPAMAPISQGF